MYGRLLQSRFSSYFLHKFTCAARFKTVTLKNKHLGISAFIIYIHVHSSLLKPFIFRTQDTKNSKLWIHLQNNSVFICSPAITIGIHKTIKNVKLSQKFTQNIEYNIFAESKLCKIAYLLTSYPPSSEFSASVP